MKELGVVISECSCLAQQLLKVFEIYWIAGKDSSTPQQWPNSVTTSVNLFNQPNVLLNGVIRYVSSPLYENSFIVPLCWSLDISFLIDSIQYNTRCV